MRQPRNLRKKMEVSMVRCLARNRIMIDIQYGTSFGYPITCVGSHVSQSPNIWTGRENSCKTRAEVAMAGTFGYELDVRKLSIQERNQVKKQVLDFKRFYRVIHFGDYYRLTNPEEEREFAAWQFVDKDGKESLVSVVLLHAKANAPFCKLRIKGLKKAAKYMVEGDSRVYRGSALMNGGIPLPVTAGDYHSIHYYIKELIE